MLSRSFWVCSGTEPACARSCATRSLLIVAWTCCQPSVAARSENGKVLEKSAAPVRLDPRWSNSLRLGLDTKFEVILTSPYFRAFKKYTSNAKKKTRKRADGAAVRFGHHIREDRRNLFLRWQFYSMKTADRPNGPWLRPENQLNAVSEISERRLIEAAQADPARFGELYELHFDRVYAYVSRRLNDRDAAQDVTSEVFHHALANLKQFEWRGAPFGAWLMRIASNAITDRWRRQNRESGQTSEIEAVSKDPNPEEIQHRARLFGLVRTLPEDQRRVIEMRF